MTNQNSEENCFPEDSALNPEYDEILNARECPDDVYERDALNG